MVRDSNNPTAYRGNRKQRATLSFRYDAQEGPASEHDADPKHGAASGHGQEPKRAAKDGSAKKGDPAKKAAPDAAPAVREDPLQRVLDTLQMDRIQDDSDTVILSQKPRRDVPEQVQGKDSETSQWKKDSEQAQWKEPEPPQWTEPEPPQWTEPEPPQWSAPESSEPDKLRWDAPEKPHDKPKKEFGLKDYDVPDFNMEHKPDDAKAETENGALSKAAGTDPKAAFDAFRKKTALKAAELQEQIMIKRAAAAEKKREAAMAAAEKRRQEARAAAIARAAEEELKAEKAEQAQKTAAIKQSIPKPLRDKGGSKSAQSDKSDKKDGKQGGKQSGASRNTGTVRKPGKQMKSAKGARSGQKSSVTSVLQSILLGLGSNGNGSQNTKKPKTPKVLKTPKKPKKRRSKAARIILAMIKVFLAFAIVGAAVGGAYAAYTIAHAPAIHPENIYNTLDVSTHIYDDKGKLMDDIYYDENREIVTYEQLPDNLKNAFIAIEDKTFWTHKGVNYKRMIGAIWNSLTGGGEISGTSTITQQLARNVYLPEEKSIRSLKRKIIEVYYAKQIEETLSKEEILTAYLNTIYLGYGCYGVDTAAKKYFSVTPEELTLEECAALAALPQAPGVYALLTTEPDDYTTDLGDGLYANDISADRRYMVLDLMAEQGYITQEQADTAKRPVAEFINPGKESVASKSAFKDYLIETVTNDLMAAYDLTEEQATKLVYTKGLNIYSTMDRQAQKVVTKEFKKKSSFPKTLKEKSNVEAAMVIVEVGTGQIKAMAGTRDVSGEKLFNRATNPRQPGSSIKPIAVYAPALQKSYEYQKEGKKFPLKDTGYDTQGKKYWGDYITAASGVKDEKMKVNGKNWPQNFGRTFTGYKTFRQALQQSINTCAVKILAQVGIDYSMEMVKKFGITTVIDDPEQPYNDLNYAALGLGAMTEGVTPLEMALAYATFPNEGVRNSGICYTQVTDSSGKVLLEGKSEETRVLNKGVAYIMCDLLQTVVSDGIAGNAAIAGERVGGKTGTTDETWDIWFDGFTPKYAAALWIGTDDNAELNTTSETAAALWGRIMGKVKRAKGGSYKSRPDNVSVKNGEYFTKGTEPPDPPPEEKKKDKDKKKEEAAQQDAAQQQAQPAQPDQQQAPAQ